MKRLEEAGRVRFPRLSSPLARGRQEENEGYISAKQLPEPAFDGLRRRIGGPAAFPVQQVVRAHGRHADVKRNRQTAALRQPSGDFAQQQRNAATGGGQLDSGERRVNGDTAKPSRRLQVTGFQTAWPVILKTENVDTRLFQKI